MKVFRGIQILAGVLCLTAGLTLITASNFSPSADQGDSTGIGEPVHPPGPVRPHCPPHCIDGVKAAK
jgi:hypothetical protein